MLGKHAVAAIGALLFGAVTADHVHAETLVLYAAQHEQTVTMITDAFTKKTGIEVKVRKGEPPELASELVKEGAKTPADIYFTANSPELMLLSEKGLLAKVPASTAGAIPSKYSSPKGDWLGVLARENVLAFNTSMVKESDLPVHLEDLASPTWKGKLAIAPTDADFLPLVGAYITVKGKAAALEWLKALKANAQIFDDNEAVVAAVDRGGAAIGIINNYYWPRLRLEVGPSKIHSDIHHFADGDVGALVNVSGAAILTASKHKQAAEAFLQFLVSKPVQTMLAKSDVTFEYPLLPGIAANPTLRPFGQLHPPTLTVEAIGDDREAASLLQEAGLI